MAPETAAEPGADRRRAAPEPESPTGVRRAYHAGRRPRRWLWWLAGLVVVAALFWLFFPGPPLAEVSAGKLEFGTVRVGEAGDEQAVAVINRGERRLEVHALTIAGEATADYELVDDGCVGSALATGESCNLRVRFRPQTPGDRSTRLLIEGNDREEPGVALEALAVAPRLGLAPTTMSFGVVPLEGDPVARKVTLSNVGTDTLRFARIRIDGPAQADFSRSRRCPSSRLDPGEACSFDIRFKPSVSGDRRAKLIVDSDAFGGAGELPLDGTGLWEGPPLDPEADRLDLGEQRVGVRGAAGEVVFVNRTGGPVSVNKTVVSGSSSFAVVEDGCRESVVPSGDRCSIALTFLPVEDGPVTGRLRLSATGASEDSTVGLAGLGVTPRLAVAQTAVDFKQQRVGFESAPRRLRFTNSGTATLTFQSSAISGREAGDFLVRANQCVGKAMAPGKSCSLDVGFSPARRGPRAATLIVDPGFDLPVVRIGLSGSGAVSALKVRPSRLDFGDVYLGRFEELDLAITNDGAARLQLAGLRFEGDDASAFALTEMGCALDAGLAPGAGCRFKIAFEGTVAKTHRAELVLSYNGPDSPAKIQLTGIARTPAPAFRISTDSLDLGSARVGGRGEIGTVVISNPGAAWLDLKSVVLRGDHAEDFQLVAGTCDGVTALAPSGSCTVGVRLAPGAVGPRRGTIVVRHGAGAGVAQVSLRGTGL